MKVLGHHLLIEYHGCDAKLLANKRHVRNAMVNSSRTAGATIVAEVFHKFSPHGVSGVVVIAESHVAVHTWPEHRFAAVDVFSCTPRLKRDLIRRLLKNSFHARKVSSREIKRGRLRPGRNLHLPRPPSAFGNPPSNAP